MNSVNITIIGAGIIGLSIAKEMSESGKNILLLEKHDSFGRESSSRNSEVIHAGIYYNKDSLKAKTCLEGNRLLYEFCKQYEIPHKKIGKLIVAINDSEAKALNNLFQKGKANGAKGLKLMDAKEIKNIEPLIEAKEALFSPNSGIVDSHSFMKKLELLSKSNGVDIVYNVMVNSIEYKNNRYKIGVKDADGEVYFFETKKLINSAGLESDKIAEMCGIDIDKKGYRLNYCKGEYFRVSGKKYSSIKKLIYPVPKKASQGLGIHLTPDLTGGLRLGPDHEYIENGEIDYSVEIKKKKAFFESVKKFFPSIEENDISPDTSGVRPRLYKEDEKERDFIIKEESRNGLPGLINLIGIESPGLTSSLSIAKIVKKLLAT